MKFFEWLNGPEISEVDRASRILLKEDSCHPITVGNANTHYHYVIGTKKYEWLSSFFTNIKVNFIAYDVKFSKSGNEALISKNGKVDFFFATKEEVDFLKEAIKSKFRNFSC